MQRLLLHWRTGGYQSVMMFCVLILFISFGMPISISAQTKENCANNVTCSSTSSITDACRTGGICNVAERNVILRELGNKCGGTNTSSCTGEEMSLYTKARGEWQNQTQENKAAAEGDCSIFSGRFMQCAWEFFLNSLGTLLMTISAYILLFAGTVFDAFLKYMVLNFQDTFSAVMPGIKLGWQLFRDMANLGIIGVFVFVAIMTILGSAEYGAKRLVARILIVAVLINFSFLFTNIVIEGTNFISNKFWQAMSPTIQKDGTAQTFLNQFKIKDYWTDSAKLVAAAAESGKKSQNSWTGLLYGLVGAVMLIAISAVLLYGAFVITARALLLLFALLTSSIAFASIMLSSKTTGAPYVGWEAWLSNLLKAALFGPLLILFLFITMKIIDAASQSTNAGAAVSALARNPAELKDANIWSSLIMLIVGTAILFIAIRAAGSFASSIAGYNQLKFGLGAMLAYGARGTGAVGRFAFGRQAAAGLQANKDALESAKLRQAVAQLNGTRLEKWRAAASLNMLKMATKGDAAVAKSQLNMLNNAIGKQVLKGLGAGGLIGGKAESAMTRAERLAKEAAKKGGEAGLSKDAQKKVVQALEKHHEDDRKIANKQLDAAQQTLTAVRGTQAHKAEKDTEQQATEQIKKLGVEMQEALQKGDKSTADRLNSNMKEEAARIETARAKITDLEKDAIEQIRLKQEALAKVTPEELAKRVKKYSDDKKSDAAAKHAAGTFGNPDGYIANMARDKLKKAGDEDKKWEGLPKSLRKRFEKEDEGKKESKGEKDEEH